METCEGEASAVYLLVLVRMETVDQRAVKWLNLTVKNQGGSQVEPAIVHDDGGQACWWC